MNSRNQALDVLRGVAVLMVIVHHYAPSRDSILHVGGTGVDLFFVLSGYLISGLLFSEMLATGQLSLLRFFTRRGFKIYPAFYTFILLTYWFVPAVDRGRVWAEVFFLQSYLPHIWRHTWSLSVEEMFYLAFPLLLLLLLKFRALRCLPMVAIAVMIAGFLFRARTMAELDGAHLRMDGLFIGVLLGYFRHFHRDWFYRVAHCHWLLAPALLLLSAAINLYPSSRITAAAVYSSIYSGFALLVWWSQGNDLLRSELLATIGRYSYSIYLWHMPVFLFWAVFIPYGIVGFLGNLISAIVVGIAAAELVEVPLLRVRNRVFPGHCVLSVNTPPPIIAALVTNDRP